MAKFLFVYHGGKPPKSPADAKKEMDAWGAWFGSMGASVIDGGTPVKNSRTVMPDGTVCEDGGANPASGYSLIEAPSLDEALKKAKGSPILKSGGCVEVAQAIDM